MSGSFSLSLLELLAYLVPGGVLLAGLIHRYDPSLEDRILAGGVGTQIAFLICSYIVGHILTLVSFLLAKLRDFLNKLSKRTPLEERFAFYQDLIDRLHNEFILNPTKSDEYLFSLRIVSENQPQSGQTIDRLFALTLFSRNTCLSFLLISALYMNLNGRAAAASVVIAILFFIRYVQLEDATAVTVFRAAYIYLINKDKMEGKPYIVAPEDV